MLNTFCPGPGSNQDLLRGSQTLYRVAIKAGLYRKAVQVCIIPNITTQGLCGRRYNKLRSPELIHIFENHNIVLFTETWTNDYSDIMVDGFSSFVLNRTVKHPNAKRDSGGLIIYISNDLIDKVTLFKTVSDCLLWLKLDGSLFDSNEDFYIALCYNPPEGSSREMYSDGSIFDMIFEEFINLEELSVNCCNIFICGDLSDFVENDSGFIADLLPDDYVPDQALPRFSEDSICNEYGTCLLDLCKSSGLRIVNGRVGDDKYNGRVTCVKGNGKSVVDYVLCKQELFDMISEFVIDEPNILSDHCMIKFSLIAKQGLGVPNATKGGPRRQSFTYKWDETKKSEYIDRLGQVHILEKLNDITDRLSYVDTEEGINENINGFYKIISEVCDPLFKKNIKPSNNKTAHSNVDQNWFDDDCKQKRKEFYENLNFYRNDKSGENRLNMNKTRSKYKRTIRNAKYKDDKAKTAKLEKAQFQNAKEYWKMLKNLNESHSEKALSADIFADYFKAINDPNDTFFQPDEDAILFNKRYVKGEFQVMFHELNIMLSEQEIRVAINQLKLGKSCGPDNVINELFRYGVDALLPYLLKLYNTVFDSGCFPEKWTDGFIVPLHKKGSKCEVENYGGITLLSTFGKLFSRVLNNRLNEWAESYHVYIKTQAGFRRKMGTIDNVFVLHGLIRHLINEGKHLYVAFVDFTKAFDYVVRENLWLKLIKIGVRGKILNVIKSMYSSVKSMVKYDNCLSQEFSCYLGVRQGECLSPFLFSIYLNDIETDFINNECQSIDIGLLKVFLMLYADDIVIFANDEQGLQKGLDVLHNYCQKWKLKVNVNKTKIMVFRSGGLLRRNLAFLYDGKQIEIVQRFTYLGIVFTTGGSFSVMFETLAGQARKAIFKLNKYLYKFTNVSPKHYIELFDKLIKPVLHYGAEIWGFSNSNMIERVHLQFCKALLGVKRTTQNDFVYGELGRLDLKHYRLISIIKYWFKILACDNTKYIKNVYSMMLNDLEVRQNKQNWASSVRTLLESLGFNDVWYFQGVGNVNMFLSMFKQRVSDTFLQNWNDRIANSSRARSYSLFSNFSYKIYLDQLSLEKFRHAISRI